VILYTICAKYVIYIGTLKKTLNGVIIFKKTDTVAFFFNRTNLTNLLC